MSIQSVANDYFINKSLEKKNSWRNAVSYKVSGILKLLNNKPKGWDILIYTDCRQQARIIMDALTEHMPVRHIWVLYEMALCSNILSSEESEPM